MNFTDFVTQAGVKQNTFRGSRFARINMCSNSDVSGKS
jgi:hypothetical protein